MPMRRCSAPGGRMVNDAGGSQSGAMASTESTSSRAASSVAMRPPRLVPTTDTTGETSRLAQSVRPRTFALPLDLERSPARALEWRPLVTNADRTRVSDPALAPEFGRLRRADVDHWWLGHLDLGQPRQHDHVERS